MESDRELHKDISAVAALIDSGDEPIRPRVMVTLNTVLSQSWVQAADAWCNTLDAVDHALLARHGLTEVRLRSALCECMRLRCSGALDHLDYFEAGVDADPILSRWREFLALSGTTDFVPSLTAYNYLVSQNPVVKASRMAVWDDPEFMPHVADFAQYQRACEGRVKRV